MTQKMRKLFALLMAIMMLCASLPLDALAQIAPHRPAASGDTLPLDALGSSCRPPR